MDTTTSSFCSISVEQRMFAYSASFGALLLELRHTKEPAKFVAGVVFEFRSVLGIRNRLITCDSARGDEAERCDTGADLIVLAATSGTERRS